MCNGGYRGFIFCFMPTLVSTCFGFKLDQLTSVGNPWRLYLTTKVRLPHPMLNKWPLWEGGGWGGRIKVPFYPVAYCIDTVVDTQVQQVATAQTLRKSKVAAPVVLFYFLFLSNRKGESPCLYILNWWPWHLKNGLRFWSFFIMIAAQFSKKMLVHTHM